MTLLTDTIGTTDLEIKEMMLEIKHRYTDAVLFACELPQEIAKLSAGRQLGYAIKEALKARANLAGANLAGAYLAGAYLARADLARADLADADTSQTDPAEPYTRSVDPDRYAKRAAKFRERNPDVPVIEKLDAKILSAIEAGGHLDMSRWHTCETTHCMAGWAITLAGDEGKRLESDYGAAIAGRYLYLASTGRVPHFYAVNDRAMADLRARAAEQI